MRRYRSDVALRRGFFDGLIVAAVMAVVVVLAVVVFPLGPDESDSVWPLLAGYLLLAALFVVIGVRGGRRAGTPVGGFKAGLAAGFVIAFLAMLDYFVVNNLFFSIVSRQHDKLVSFQASGWTSMRDYVNFQLLTGAVFVIPIGTLVAGGLGLFGGALGVRESPVRS